MCHGTRCAHINGCNCQWNSDCTITLVLDELSIPPVTSKITMVLLPVIELWEVERNQPASYPRFRDKPQTPSRRMVIESTTSVETDLQSSIFTNHQELSCRSEGSIIVGQLVARMGKYKVLAILGMIFSVVGSALLLRLGVSSTSGDILLAMLVLGIGMGFSMALYTLIVQNALPTKIGQATAALTFFRSIGGTIGLALMGSLMSATYVPTFTRALPSQVRQVFPATFLVAFNNPQVLLSPSAQVQLRREAAQFGSQGGSSFASVLESMRVGLSQGIHTVFLLSFMVMAIGLVAVVFLRDIPLGTPRKSETSPQQEVQPLVAKEVR
jgi:hypothetical protein